VSQHFKVHELLSREELDKLEAFAREPGRTVDECHEWLQAHGFTLSRSAVGAVEAAFDASDKFRASNETARALVDAAKSEGTSRSATPRRCSSTSSAPSSSAGCATARRWRSGRRAAASAGPGRRRWAPCSIASRAASNYYHSSADMTASVEFIATAAMWAEMVNAVATVTEARR
jgi:hypothetical protein